MSRSNLGAVADFLRRLGDPGLGADCTDRELLRRFSDEGDQGAFAAVVQRHGALVVNVCRRLLRHDQDAEDAFQATFVVLARKADAISWTDSITCWLHEVAWRTAAELRGRRVRERQRETTMPAPPEVPAPGPPQDSWDELSGLLDEELRRLPEKYRAPLVLCYLEGRSRDEAAELLGWSEGSVKGRLERGRELLRGRLLKRGITVGAGLGVALPAGLAQASPSTLQMARAVELAVAGPTAGGGMAIRVAEIILARMARGKLGFWVGTLVVLLGAGVGSAALLSSRREIPEQGPVMAPPPEQPAPPRATRLTALDLEVGPVTLHDGTVESLALTADGQHVATAAFNDGFTLLSTRHVHMLHQWTKKGPHTLIAISKDDQRVAGGTITGEISLYDLTTKDTIATWRMDRGNLFTLAFTPDGKLLMVGSTDGSIALFDAASGNYLRDLRGNQGRPRGLSFLPGGDVLLYGGEDGTIRFWDWKAGKELEKMAAHPSMILSVAVSKDGRRLVTGGVDKTIRFWDVEQRRELFSRSCDFPNTVALSPDGWVVACGNNRGRVLLWRAADGVLLRDVVAHQGGVQCIRFTADGRHLFSCGSDRRLARWQIRTVEEVLP